MSLQLNNPNYAPLLSRYPYLKDPLQDLVSKRVGDMSSTFQSPSTVILSAVAQNILYSMVFPVFGHAIATALIERMACSSRIVAAHHLGIDCLPEQVQCSHYLELHNLLHSPHRLTVLPVLACSSVPLQSFTFPRGLIASSLQHMSHTTRYALYSNAYQNRLVYTTPAIEKNLITRIKNQWDASFVSKRQWECIQHITEDYILHDDCLSLDDFSKQVMYCNAKIFHDIYPENPNTHIIYINLEDLSRELIIHDMQNTESLLYQTFFTKKIRHQILQTLVNERGCWVQDAIDGKDLQRTAPTGTVFFWGIDAQGRRVPLVLREKGIHAPVLCYQDIEIPFTPESLCTALFQKRIYPSLYSSFITLNLQHSILCYGGIYMFRYLPRMLEVTLRALKDFGYETMQTTQAWSAFRSFASLGSGIISVQCATSDGALIPAGSIELMAHGGLRRSQLLEIAQLPLADILPLTLREWSLLHVVGLKDNPELCHKLSQSLIPWKGLVLS